MSGKVQFAQASRKRARAVEDTAEIDADGPVPMCDGHVPDIVGAGADAGVVAHDLDGSEGALGIGSCVLPRGGIGHVENLLVHRGTFVAQGRSLGRETRAIDIGERNLQAAAGERLGDREADSRSPTCDEGRFSRNVLHA